MRDSSPAFSPDGSTIVFVRGPSSGSTEGIWAMGADGSCAHQLTDPGPGVADSDPDVSPDGSSILFDRYDGSTQRLWIMDANGRPATSDFKPTWGRIPTPPIDSPPTISGTVRVGHSLTAASGATSFGGTPSFQWLRCDSAGNGCAAIAGAAGQSYSPKNADAGKRLKVRQTQSGVGGSVTADSAATARVLKEPGARISATATVTGGKALVKLSCPRTQNQICAGTLTLTAKLTASASRKHTVRAGRAKFRIRAGKRKTVKVRLSRKVLSALAAQNGKLKVKASTVSADAARNKTTVRRTVKLKLKRKRAST